MPLDIFIPYWGDPKYMRETVESVLAQDSADWKLTVVDDAYPDLAIQQYMQALSSDPRITYIRKPRNEGITANYETCLSLATEDVMMFLGSDDVLLPNYVSTINAAHAQFPDAAVIQPGVEVIDENSQNQSTLADTVKQKLIRPRTASRVELSGEKLATGLLHGDWLYWPSLAFRTDKLRTVSFRDGFPLIQDLAIVMDMIFQGNSLVFDPTVCFRYRRHLASASSSTLIDGTRFEGERRYFGLAQTLAEERNWRRTSRAAQWRLTSRAHALSLIPGTLLKRNWSATKTLFHHASTLK